MQFGVILIFHLKLPIVVIHQVVEDVSLYNDSLEKNLMGILHVLAFMTVVAHFV